MPYILEQAANVIVAMCMQRGLLTELCHIHTAGTSLTAYYTREEFPAMETGGNIWYYIYDGHGTARLLTNEAGQITDRYAYDAYGNL